MSRRHNNNRTTEGQGKGASSASPRRISAREKQAKALKLRLAGATFQEIADKVGYAGRQSAQKAVTKAMQDTIQEPADELRRLEMMRLDRLQLAVWPAAMRGDVKAVTAVLRIMVRRSNLLGLDAPRRLDIRHAVEEEARRLAQELGLDPDEIIAEAEGILRRAAGSRQPASGDARQRRGGAADVERGDDPGAG